MLALLPSIYQGAANWPAWSCLARPAVLLNRQQAEQLARDGAIVVEEVPGSEALLLIANGSYQLGESAPPSG